MIAFEGNRLDLEVFLSEISGCYYVYELCRPNGDVFYVGKGLNRRAIEHELEAIRQHPIGETNPFKCNVIRQILSEGGQIIYRIDRVFNASEELMCLEREAVLIETHGRRHEGGDTYQSCRRPRLNIRIFAIFNKKTRNHTVWSARK